MAWFRWPLLSLLALGALALGQPARAEDPPESQLITDLKAGRITRAQAFRNLADRTLQLEKTCEISAVQAWRRDYDAYFRILAAPQAPASSDELVNAINIEDYLDASCHSATVRTLVRGAAENCELNLARTYLDRLRALAENYRRQANNARGAGQFSAVNPALAARTAETAKADYDRAKADFDKAQQDCEKDAEEQHQQEQVEEVDEAPADDGACVRPADCARYGPLLGRWTSQRGGVLETTLEADGTLTGRIVTASRYMEDNGYTAGMVVLRGWAPGPATQTWLMAARDGESLSAVKPGRKPGEIFGDPVWENGGVIYLATANPDRLEFPSSLLGRLSNYDPWVRMSGDPRTVRSRTGRNIEIADDPRAPPEVRPRDNKKMTVDDDTSRVEDPPRP